jgi:hypothetical protein
MPATQLTRRPDPEWLSSLVNDGEQDGVYRCEAPGKLDCRGGESFSIDHSVPKLKPKALASILQDRIYR